MIPATIYVCPICSVEVQATPYVKTLLVRKKKIIGFFIKTLFNLKIMVPYIPET